MRYFPRVNGSIWSSKINFVDENNVLLGYDFGSSCCEDFGWYITDELSEKFLQPNSPLRVIDDEHTVVHINETIKDYSFDASFFQKGAYEEGDGYSTLNDGNYAVFKIVDNDQVKYLYLYNYQNGYYSHGFEFFRDVELIEAGLI